MMITFLLTIFKKLNITVFYSSNYINIRALYTPFIHMSIRICIYFTDFYNFITHDIDLGFETFHS